MCGRFALTTSDMTLAELLRLAQPPALQPRYNIAPTQPLAALRSPSAGTERRLDMLRWGLIPSWAKDAAIGHRMINARAETVAEKPAYRVAFRRRRCLIPATGFYEWQKPKIKGPKQPHYIRLADDRPFAFAGLWESWTGPDQTIIESATIITTTPNDLLQPIHDRMPVILGPDEFDRWLDPERSDPRELAPLLRPFPAELMTAYPVTTHVNKPQNDDPTCIQPQR
ncbi:MAG: SOS response-associated peptidase [Phycisphaerae bacterium]